ncbi:fibrocystin-L-like [Antedon mediterranea]|uniref:fibrocystin-L-like n=1 Tax=Antedon mediterranea TaxID=105859 RepID=UPI003AF861F4
MIEWNGKSSAVSATYSAKQMKELLEGYFSTGLVAVEKTSTCLSSIWNIEWTEIGGNHEPIEINGTGLVGDDVDIKASTDVDGALVLSPIPGDYLRTPHSSPQVEVYINEVISSCATDNCTFDYNEDYTAEITNIDKHAGSEAEQTTITITGTGFSIESSENIVTIGGDIACEVQSCDETQIVCDVQNGKTGIYEVEVNVVPFGYAESSTDVSFNYTVNITSIEPESGSESGGTEVNIYGHGFSNIPEENTVFIGSTRCVVTQSSFNFIICTLEVQNESRRRRSTNTVDVYVEIDNHSHSKDNAFTQDPALTPTISSISPTSSSVLGGGTIVILGSSYGTKEPMVTINKLECSVTSFNDTEIQCTIPGNEPGIYDVTVSVPGKGYAKTGQQFSYDLVIEGIFPDHGSLQGGTTVFITGSGFGTNTSLVDVSFGFVTCDITDLNDDLIQCTSGSSGVVHTVTNQGKHEEYGVGYKWDPQVLKIIAGDTVMWQWSTPALVDSVGYTVQQTADADSVVYDGEGFYAGSRSKSGTYTYTFNNEGEYYYSSGPVNSDVPEKDKFYLTGVIYVAPFRSVAYPLSVKLNEISANHDFSAQSNTPTDSSSCPGNDDTISGCSSAMPFISDTSLFSFAFWDCSTANIDVITPLIGSAEQTITIEGSGFSDVACENVVTIGYDHTCTVIFSNANLIECTIETNNSLLVGYYHKVSVNVKNRGYAMNFIDTLAERSYILVPSITSVDPSEGSLNGGTVLTIEGNGFSASSVDELIVSLGPESCLIQSFNYTHIICATTSHDVSGHIFNVAIELNHRSSINIGGQPINFIYQQHLTMQVQNVFPDTISGVLTTIYVNGSDFGDVISDITVTFGNVDCAVVSVNSEEIECEVGYVPVGDLPITVHRKRYGNANLVNFETVWGDAVINTISPQQGSTEGGTLITIEGSGFHTDDTSVVIDGDVCDITFVNISMVTCITNSHSAATTDFLVTSNGENFHTQSFEFTSSATPKITSVSPSSGNSGDSITIRGVNFGSSTADVEVTVDGEDCTVVGSVTATEIICEVPSHGAGMYMVEAAIFNLGKASSVVTFEYILSITSSFPIDGSFAGTKTLNLTGSGFDEDRTKVTVCGNPCDVTSGTYTFVQCLIPANDGIASSTVSCDIVVLVDSGLNTTLSDAFTYKSSLTAFIDSVEPTRGGTGGGTDLTITGTGFRSSGNVVTLDGSECIISSESTTMIECTTEAHQGSIKTHARVVTDDNDNIATQDNGDYYYIDVWSSVWTWGGLEPPIAGDFVIVPAGQTLLLDVNTPILSMLLIEGGEFIFDEKDIELHAENILITDGGLLQVGTEQEPFQHKATIMMHGHQRSQELPLFGAKTLAVRNGTLDLHGIPVPVTWTYLTQTAVAGSTTLVLEQSVTWNVGDQIAIASTGHRHSQRENEIVRIVDISSDGLTLEVEPALEYEHISIEQTLNGVFLSTKAEVGLLTHNVVVRGSVQDEWTETIEACEEEFNTNQFATQTCFQGRYGEEIGSDQFGSQIMLFGKYQNQQLVTGRIEYVEVTHAGQAFRLGRYPIHFHLNGDVSGSYVRGCGIHHTFNRAVTIHAVDNLLVEHNVAYDIMGHAYFMEDGIEMGNTVQYNLGVFVKSSSSLLNVDVTPAAFWVTNPNNTVRHNAAAGGSHFGFWYNMPAHPGGPSYTTSMCPRKMVMGEFINNTAHSQGWYGIWIFPEYHPMEGGQCNSKTPTQAKFYSLTAWKVERGAEAIAVGGVQFHDFLISDADKAGIEYQTIDSDIPFDNDGALVKNSTIIGHSAISNAYACTSAGIHGPKSSGLTIDGVQFINFNEGRCAALRACAHCKTDQGGFHTRVKNLEFTDSPNKVAFQWQHEHWFEDLDGTLTGSANHIVLPNNPNLPPAHCTKNDAFSINVDGVFCDDTVKLHRMAFNGVSPSSLGNKDTLFTNQHGTSRIPYHPGGWMITLIERDTYNFIFEDVDHVTNITYRANFYNFNDGDYVVINHNFTQSPDVFATIGYVTKSTKQMVTYENNSYGEYYFNNDDNNLYYLVSGKDRHSTEGDTLPINLQVYRCYYLDCIPPVPEPVLEPVPAEGSPDNVSVLLWSTAEAWEGVEDGWGGNDNGSFVLPIDGDDVMILPEKWVVADVPLPNINLLYIFGTLEIEDTRDNCINATYIFIHGGTLVIGWEKSPFQHQLHIFLNGNHFTEDFPLPNGPNMGAKVLGVFGGLEMHGVSPNITWTHLSSSLIAGDDIIYLRENVTWKVGDEIVVASTSYEAWETETFMIIEIINNHTVRINDTAKYKHIAETVTLEDGSLTYTEAAEVGLLTRNIQIIGADYSNLFEESFGARVLIGKFNQDGIEYKGYAKISNVEFKHSGQEGWTDFYDPRYSVAFLDIGEVTGENPSFLRECTFHNGFSPAIGVFGTSGLTIQDNVIHHTVGAGIIAWGRDHQILHNLVTLTVFPGTYQDRYNAEDISWPAGIEIESSRDVILQDNTVAGSERVLYHISGEICDVESQWSNNEGHTSLHGVHLLTGDGQRDCTQIANFFIWKNWDYGVFFQISSSVVMTDLVLADNNIGVMPFVIWPSSLSHKAVDKFVRMESSFIIGTSPFFDCYELQNQPENAGQSAKQRAPRGPDNGNAGFVWANFMSGDNGAPFFPFHGIHNYPAIAGSTRLQDVTFAYFDSACNKDHYAIMTNPSNDDGIHPMSAVGTKMVTVRDENRVYIHRPNLGKVNPSDCVDMDCDAFKKAMIRDEDGGILGGSRPGYVIPDSSYEWDGDPRRGLGDYRIPNMMVTDIDGSKIPYDEKCPHKGIIGTESCIWHDSWQAFECYDYDYAMLIIESLDPDTEVRRLSPIAIGSNGYVDLINGPQDHGWCHGYTCQERISTFMSIVAIGETYEMYMSSTNPQTLRLHFLNTTPDQKIVVGIWYANPQRLDVYHQGRYVMPNNGQLDGDTFIWVPEDPNGTDDQFMPTPDSNIYGENYFDRDWQTLWILIRGSDPIDIITTPVIMVDVGVAPVDVDDFYEEDLVNNLASLLGVDESQIRVVDVVREGGRRKRSTEFQVLIEIGESPRASSNSSENSGNSTLEYDELVNLQVEIVNTAQTGTLSESLEVEVISLAMTDPSSPAEDPTGGVRATNETGGPSTGNETYSEKQAEEEAASEPGVAIIYQFPSTMSIHVQPADATENHPFGVQPCICILDTSGNIVQNLGHSSHPWKMQAVLQRPGVSDAELVSNNTVDIIYGWANFTDLAINLPGSGYFLEFSIVYPNTSTLEGTNSMEFSVSESVFYISIADQPTSPLKVLETFDVQFNLIEDFTTDIAEHLDSKNYNWTANISLYMPENYRGTLQGQLTTQVDLTSAQGVFYNLSISATGFQYVLQIEVVTIPSNDYYLSAQLDQFDISNVDKHTENPVKVGLKFYGDYATVAAGKEDYLAINFINNFAVSYPKVTISSVEISEGSIIFDFIMTGDTSNTLEAIFRDLGVGLISLTFDGHILEADPSYIMLNGKPFEPKVDDPSGLPIWAIVLIVIISLLMVFIMGAALVRVCYSPKHKVSKIEKMALTEMVSPVKMSGYANESEEETSLSSSSGSNQLLISMDELQVPRASSSRSKSPGFNTPSRTPEIMVTALPPGFADGSHEQVMEDRANMYVMFSTPERSFKKIGLLSVNLVGTLSTLRADLKESLGSKLQQLPFAFLSESLVDIDGASERRRTVHETYASDSVLIRYIEGKDLSKLCICGLIGQFECSLCHSQTYCSPTCQSYDWAKHCKICSGM